LLLISFIFSLFFHFSPLSFLSFLFFAFSESIPSFSLNYLFSHFLH
jgi:hypothetical protein